MSDWQQVRRILAIRLDNLGDVLMTTPALRALRAAPGRHLTLLTSSSGAALDGHLPMVDALWRYDAPWVKQATAVPNVAQDMAMIDRLRSGHFDAAVIFTVYSQSALPATLMCRLAGIPRCLAHCRENPYALLSDHVIEREPQNGIRHEVTRQLELVATVGANAHNTRLAFAVRPRDRQTLRARLRRTLGWQPHRTGRWLVIHPGATAASRRWPAERFGHVAAQLADDFDAIAVTGSASERALVESVCAAAGPKALPLAGTLTLGELGALIEQADLLIANNSGPVHLAAAVGTPVVDLYAMTNPQHTPWQVPHRVLQAQVPCAYCYRSVCLTPGHPCLTGVQVDDVVAAAQSLLHEVEMKEDVPHIAPAPTVAGRPLVQTISPSILMLRS